VTSSWFFLSTLYYFISAKVGTSFADRWRPLCRPRPCRAVAPLDFIFFLYYFILGRPRWCCATNRKDAGSIPAGVSGFFIDIKSFRSLYRPGVDSASNRNEYQEYFLGKRRPVCKADNLTNILCCCHEVWEP